VHTKKAAKASRPTLAKQLRIVIVVALLAATTGGVLIVWDFLPFAVPPVRLIHVYRTHGCRCVFAWAKTLEAEGFVVRLYEYETLQYVRASLGMPEDLRSCHVGKYLGYFVEGHISSATLHWLEQRHPQGRGVAVKGTGGAQVLHASGMPAKGSTVLFYDSQDTAKVLSDG
jgi:hypothetical protein